MPRPGSLYRHGPIFGLLNRLGCSSPTLTQHPNTRPVHCLTRSSNFPVPTVTLRLCVYAASSTQMAVCDTSPPPSARSSLFALLFSSTGCRRLPDWSPGSIFPLRPSSWRSGLEWLSLPRRLMPPPPLPSLPHVASSLGSSVTWATVAFPHSSSVTRPQAGSSCSACRVWATGKA